MQGIKDNHSESDANIGRANPIDNKFQEKLIKKRKKHAEKNSCNIERQKILRQDAFKVNYDFYFKNN